MVTTFELPGCYDMWTVIAPVRKEEVGASPLQGGSGMGPALPSCGLGGPRSHLRACPHWTVAPSLLPFGADRRTIPRGRAQSRKPGARKQTMTAVDMDS